MNARDKWIKDVDWRRKGKRREKTPTKSMKRKFIDWTREKKRTNSSHSLAIETIRNLCRRLFEFYFCLFLFRLITCYSPVFGWHFFGCSFVPRNFRHAFHFRLFVNVARFFIDVDLLCKCTWPNRGEKKICRQRFRCSFLFRPLVSRWLLCFVSSPIFDWFLYKLQLIALKSVE